MQTIDLRQKPLHLIVRTPEKTVYQGEAKAVSSVNEKGPFDVLGAHQNFITLIKDSLVILDTNGQKQDVPLQDGVMRVHENEVTVYVGVTTLKEE